MVEIVFVESDSQMGGVEFSTLYLTKGLDRSRWSPLVVCPEEGELPARCRLAGVETVILPRPPYHSTSARVGQWVVPNPAAWLTNLWIILRATGALERFLRERQPRLVVTKGLLTHFYGGLAARRAGVPCVWHVQDRVSHRAGPLFPWVLSLAAAGLARAVIVDGESIARQLQPCVPRERISVIHNGVDVEEFSPKVDGRAVRREFGFEANDLVLGNVSRLTPWKGQHVLLEAFARLARQYPQARLLLVGSALFDDDGYERRLRQRAAALGLASRVTFAGYRWDLPQVLAAMDVFAYTAVEKDTSPLALLSAMAAGKPIIAPHILGVQEVVGPAGLLVPPGAAGQLAEALDGLLQDSALRVRLGAAARVRAVAEFSLERFARRCEEVFASVLSAPGAAVAYRAAPAMPAASEPGRPASQR